MQTRSWADEERQFLGIYALICLAPLVPFRNVGSVFVFIRLKIKRKGEVKMKKQKTSRLAAALCLSALVVSLLFTAGCAQKVKAEGLWENATYASDKTFGEGKTTIEVEVKAEEKSVTFTINTDKENLADALLEHKLVEGEDSQYGLYIKKVNGILADYDVNQSYWSLCKNGEMLMTGASDTKISEGEHYELVYAK